MQRAIGFAMIGLLLAACSGGPPGQPPAALASVAAGDRFTCALDAEGYAWCWGHNAAGQLGDGTTTARSRRVAVLGDRRYVTLSAGADHACAIDEADRAWCWGANATGQLGDGSTTASTEPTPVAGDHAFTVLAAGGSYTCALDDAGLAWCWGGNEFGQLGDGSDDDREEPAPVAGGKTYVAITAGGGHTCAIADGAVASAYCWGWNDAGQLGDGSNDSTTSPTLVVGGPWSALAAGGLHTCGLDASLDDRIRCWGWNGLGQLGDGTGIDSNVPVEAVGGRFTAVTAGAGHSCGLGRNTGGWAWCWGHGTEGQIGDGTPLSAWEPVAATGARQYSVISAGGGHVCALAATGLWCWGDNTAGQIGDGTTTSRYVPTAVVP
jgi:alpha-tubulin suppressor-like RCC1 family protein